MERKAEHRQENTSSSIMDWRKGAADPKLYLTTSQARFVPDLCFVKKAEVVNHLKWLLGENYTHIQHFLDHAYRLVSIFEDELRLRHDHHSLDFRALLPTRAA